MLASDGRTAGLNLFNGTAASGFWMLYVADLSTGAKHQLTGWSLKLTTVPEPSTAIFVSLALALSLRRQRCAGKKD